mmetsp:Transcript_12629/g.29056  ORF Transcript_12629/g.29056 Transcript_12629/m.29056 type:complete len:239 (-) Transcript_12629:1237-1953(-)
MLSACFYVQIGQIVIAYLLQTVLRLMFITLLGNHTKVSINRNCIRNSIASLLVRCKHTHIDNAKRTVSSSSSSFPSFPYPSLLFLLFPLSLASALVLSARSLLRLARRSSRCADFFNLFILSIFSFIFCRLLVVRRRLVGLFLVVYFLIRGRFLGLGCRLSRRDADVDQQDHHQSANTKDADDNNGLLLVQLGDLCLHVIQCLPQVLNHPWSILCSLSSLFLVANFPGLLSQRRGDLF